MRAVTVKVYSVPLSRSSGVVNERVSDAKSSVLENCGEAVSQYSTTNPVISPFGISGSSQVMVIMKKEGNDEMSPTGPGTRERQSVWSIS